jgi:uncharacterized protein (DUF58 family)
VALAANPEVRPPRALPGLFGGVGLLLLLAATLVAARLEAPWVALLAGSLLLVGLLARLWARYAVARLAYGRRAASGAAAGHTARGAPTLRAFQGDTLVLDTWLSNRKPLPLPWVEVWERLPFALDAGAALEDSPEKRGYGWLSQGAALWPYQRARWRHHLACRRRGAYTLGRVRARAGDPFGLGERETTLGDELHVLVYPRVVPLQRLALPARHAALEVVQRQSLLADPTRTAWLRAYEPGDSPRLVHWPASAHRGALQVRVLERAASLSVCLVLEGRSFDLALRLYRNTLFELALSALASVAVYLQRTGYPVALYTDAAPPTVLPPSATEAQLQAILEALARVEPVLTPRPLTWEGLLPTGCTVVLAVSDLARDLPRRLELLARAGHPVLLLQAGEGAAPASAAARTLHLRPDADLAAVLEGRA